MATQSKRAVSVIGNAAVLLAVALVLGLAVVRLGWLALWLALAWPAVAYLVRRPAALLGLLLGLSL